MRHLNEKTRFLPGLLLYGFIRSVIFWPLVLSLIILDSIIFCTLLHMVFNGVSDAKGFARTIFTNIQLILDGGVYCLLVLVLVGAVIDCVLGVFRSFKDLERSMCRLSSALSSRGEHRAGTLIGKRDDSKRWFLRLTRRGRR